MTEQEWRDLYSCTVAAENSSSRTIVETARRAQDYLERNHPNDKG